MKLKWVWKSACRSLAVKGVTYANIYFLTAPNPFLSTNAVPTLIKRGQKDTARALQARANEWASPFFLGCCSQQKDVQEAKCADRSRNIVKSLFLSNILQRDSLSPVGTYHVLCWAPSSLVCVCMDQHWPLKWSLIRKCVSRLRSYRIYFSLHAACICYLSIPWTPLLSL